MRYVQFILLLGSICRENLARDKPLHFRVSSKPYCRKATEAKLVEYTISFVGVKVSQMDRVKPSSCVLFNILKIVRAAVATNL